MGNVYDPLFAKNTSSGTNEACTNVNTSQQPWFDDECQESRKLFYFELNYYRRDKNTENQSSLIRARANYKIMFRQKRFYFEKAKLQNLLCQNIKMPRNIGNFWSKQQI